MDNKIRYIFLLIVEITITIHKRKYASHDIDGKFSRLKSIGKTLINSDTVISIWFSISISVWKKHSRLIPIYYSTWPPSFSSHNRGGERRCPQNKTGVVHRYKATVEKNPKFLNFAYIKYQTWITQCAVQNICLMAYSFPGTPIVLVNVISLLGDTNVVTVSK